MAIREIGHESVEHINLAEDRVRYQTLVNTVMNFEVPQKLLISRPSERLSAPQGTVCSMELVS